MCHCVLEKGVLIFFFFSIHCGDMINSIFSQLKYLGSDT